MKTQQEQSAPSIRTQEQVMFFDTDCGGVVHNLAYLRMIETCRTKLAEVLGMPLVEMASSQCFPVVVRTEIDYVRPAKLADHLEITGVLDSISGVRFWCAFTIKKIGEPAVLVRSRQALALVQMPQGRPMRLPSKWKSAYADYWK